MKDLVQIDIETAITLYSKGYKHIPIVQGDPFSEDWTSKQPLYLDDLLESLVIFASDRKRAELMNPKPDIKTMKEDIALHYEPHFRIDPEEDDEDDDPDWTEAEPEQVESIPDDDEVPEHDRIPYEKPEVITVEQVTEKTDKPPKWNILRVNKLSNEGWSNKQLAEEYGVTEQVVKERLMHYRMK